MTATPYMPPALPHDLPALETAPNRIVFIFDGTCDFCTRSVRLIRRLDRHNRITPIPFQRSGAVDTYGLTVAQCEHAAWAVTWDGDRYPAAAAINVALSTALGTRLPRLVYRIPGMPWLQEHIYARIARNRTRLPGDTPYCDQHPEACA